MKFPLGWRKFRGKLLVLGRVKKNENYTNSGTEEVVRKS